MFPFRLILSINQSFIGSRMRPKAKEFLRQTCGWRNDISDSLPIARDVAGNPLPGICIQIGAALDVIPQVGAREERENFTVVSKREAELFTKWRDDREVLISIDGRSRHRLQAQQHQDQIRSVPVANRLRVF